MTYEIFTATIPSNRKGSDYGWDELAYRASGQRFSTYADASSAAWKMTVEHDDAHERTKMIFDIRERA